MQAHTDWSGFKLKIAGVFIALMIPAVLRTPEAFFGLFILTLIAASMMFVWYLAGARNPRPDERLLQEGIEVHAKCLVNQSSGQQSENSEFIQYEYGDGDDYYCGRIKSYDLEKSMTYVDVEGAKRLILLVNAEHTWVHFIVPNT